MFDDKKPRGRPHGFFVVENLLKEPYYDSSVSTTYTEDLLMKYAGFLPRLAAVFVDGLILMVVYAGLVVVLNGGDFESENSLVSGLHNLLVMVYFVTFTHLYQATPGKMALKIKVVDENGNKPTLVAVLIRETIGKFVSGIILFIGYLMVLFDSKKQALHDKFAKTNVVKL